MTPSEKVKLWRINNPEKLKEQRKKHRKVRHEHRMEYQRKTRTSEISRMHHLRHKFKITPEEYDIMLDNQAGVCAICGGLETRLNRVGDIRKLAIDHCHSTGKIRGLLCGACNTAIGLLKDDPQIMKQAIKYLENKDGVQ